MVFNSDIFIFAFLPIVFTVFWLARTKRERYLLLTASGYVFYGYCNWHFCFLLLFSSLVSFFAALKIERAGNQTVARYWLIGVIVVDLILLGFLKYHNFFAININHIFPNTVLPLLDIILPIGISFYTFQTISYVIDVMNGNLHPTHDILEYLTYVSLFSTLVAGPIVRFKQIEPDLERLDQPMQPDFIARGLGFFVIGLVKKVIIADKIAKLVNPMLASWGPLSVSGAWLAALGYTFQIYYDFSGYSDMAVGLGYLFGIRIPQNFNSPYQARGIGDFWRRWHISLASWFRDYLFLKLAYVADRKWKRERYLGVKTEKWIYSYAAFITMSLCGFWHGANWTFIAWGAYHGLLLILDRTYKKYLLRLPKMCYQGVTFLSVVVGWVVFRADNIGNALRWLGWMVGLGTGTQGAPVSLSFLIAGCMLAVNTIPEIWDLRLGATRMWAYAYSLAFFIAYLFMNGKDSVFLYYQF